MQRYKQHILDLYGVEDQDRYERTGFIMDKSGCIQDTNKLYQLSIQADVFGKYVGCHVPYRGYHADKLLDAQAFRYINQPHRAKQAISCARYVRYTQILRLP